MKTELVANWVVVEGHLELQWSRKNDNRVRSIHRDVLQSSKAA